MDSRRYTVVVADDEMASREGLVSFIKRCGLPLMVVGEAANGREALEMIASRGADMLLSDIRMPFLDGIALAEAVRDRGLSTKVLLISGYSDTEYLKSAVQLGAVDYILKPVQPAELMDALSRMLAISTEERARTAERARRTALLDEALPLLRERFLTDLVLTGFENERQLAARLEWIGVPLPVSRPYLAIVVGLVPEHERTVNSVDTRELALASLLVAAEATLGRCLSAVCFRSVREEIVALVPVDSEPAVFSERLQEGVDELLDYDESLAGGIRIGVGVEAGDLQRVRYSYDTARTALAQSLLDPSSVSYADDLRAADSDGELDRTAALQSIARLLRAGNRERLSDAIVLLFGSQSASAVDERAEGRALALELLFSGLSVQREIDGGDALGIREIAGLWERVVRAEAMEDLRDVSIRFLASIADRVRSRRLSKNQLVVGRIREFIQSRFADPIGIANIADELQYTTSHLCNVFKKETGKTINEYLTEVRMRRAEALLSEPARKLYEVAAAVGYNDYKHFTKLFKRFFGVGPSEYRRNNG